MDTKYRFLLLLGLSTVVACGDFFSGELAVWQEEPVELIDEPKEDALRIESPHYFLDPEDAEAQLGDTGVARIETTYRFSTVQIHIAGNREALDSLEVRAFDGDFPVMDWRQPTFDEFDLESGRADGIVNLVAEGTTLEVRTTGIIEFARFAFSDTFHDHEANIEAAEPHESIDLNALRRPGRWIPPAGVTAIANTQRLRYTGSPSRCSGGTKPGTRELANFLKYVFPGAKSWGGYNCRANTADPGRLSVHASGRAIDLFVPLDRGSADNDLGDPIANYLIANAEALGIEYLVWDRSQWSAGRSSNKQRYYGGPHPHHDHLHIEVSPTMAARTGKSYPSIFGGSGTGGGSTTPPLNPVFNTLLGDFNGDGKADITTTSAKGLGGWKSHFYTEYGRSGGFSSAARQALTPLHMRNGDANKNYRQLVGDFNGDGKSDVASLSPNGLGAWASKSFVEYGAGNGFTSQSIAMSTPQHMRNGDPSKDYRHLIGDFNGDGKDDIVTASANGHGGWADLFFVEYGTATGFNSRARSALLPIHMRNGGAANDYRHLVGDFNGDGKDDIVSVSPNGGGAWSSKFFVEYGATNGFVSASRSAALPVHMRNGGPTRDYRHFVGDFNGDGFDDIVSVSRDGAGSWSSKFFIEYGKANGFTSTSRTVGLPTHMRNGGATQSYRHLVGDFNGDGKADIASVSPNGGGSWANAIFCEYGTTNGFSSASRSAVLPVHMRNGGSANSYQHFAGDIDGDGIDDITTLSTNGGGAWSDKMFTEFGTANGFTSLGPATATPRHIRNGTP